MMKFYPRSIVFLLYSVFGCLEPKLCNMEIWKTQQYMSDQYRYPETQTKPMLKGISQNCVHLYDKPALSTYIICRI